MLEHNKHGNYVSNGMKTNLLEVELPIGVHGLIYVGYRRANVIQSETNIFLVVVDVRRKPIQSSVKADQISAF